MPIFVIHQHHARKLHWDLRLAMSDRLKSWAIPKQPPRAKGTKRLAIQVPDHAMSYAKFEGEIKQGYGKGKVKIWDKGTYKLEDKKRDKIIINFKGKKLKGRYVLIKTKFKGNKKSWLFFKI